MLRSHWRFRPDNRSAKAGTGEFPIDEAIVGYRYFHAHQFGRCARLRDGRRASGRRTKPEGGTRCRRRSLKTLALTGVGSDTSMAGSWILRWCQKLPERVWEQGWRAWSDNRKRLQIDTPTARLRLVSSALWRSYRDESVDRPATGFLPQRIDPLPQTRLIASRAELIPI